METVTFGLDGRHYEVDVSEQDARRLRDALSPFVAAGRRVAAPRPHADDVRERRGRNREVRVWARRNGFVVSDRGRIPEAVLDAYRRHRDDRNETTGDPVR